MEDLPLVFAGLLGGAYIICSLAEFLLWLFERESSANHCSRRGQPSEQESGEWSTPFEDPAPITRPSPHADLIHKPGILIADDHSLYRRILETWFREHGFTVWAAADGLEAVQLHRAHAPDIALALLDVYMPNLGGPETFIALRQETPSLPCCFMAANLHTKQETQLLALGAVHIFEKPLLLHEATAIIRDIMKPVRSTSVDLTGERG